MMETYGQLLLIAMLVFLVLIIFEKVYGMFQKEEYAPIIDGVSSIRSGLTNSTKSVLGLSIAIITYQWAVYLNTFLKIIAPHLGTLKSL